MVDQARQAGAQRGRRRLGQWLSGCALLAALAAAPAEAQRPGPDVLYEKPATAPQLTNARPFRAKPILVSGATAYRRGEFLYQDFLYDSHGAAGTRDPEDPFDPVGGFLFSPKAGTLTYPSDPAFANDAADLVEVRVKPLAKATLFRVTFNVLHPQTAFTIALGDGEAQEWPFGAGVTSPAEEFVTVHGRRVEGMPAATAAVSARRRQVTVRVPRSAWNPGRKVVRMAAGAGLWNDATGEYLAPAESRTETTPGGTSPKGARLFNLAFRSNEPIPDLKSIPGGVTIADAAAGAALLGTWWREKLQSSALADGNVSVFSAEVDFGKLRRGVRDESGVPRTGPLNRILASRRSFGEGIDYDAACGGIEAAFDTAPCTGTFVGRLQPYALYVPDRPRPPRGWGFTLLLHSLSANYNQYTGTNHQSQLGERGPGSLVATPAGRGPDGFYRDIAEADTFEVWADVRRRYKLDPGWTAVSGYSMGGLGTFRLMSRWPDLFARGFSVVGAGSPDRALASLRHTPVMMWNALGDELVNVADYEATIAELDRLGLAFSAWNFPAADHLTIATNDEYGPGADFLGEHRVIRNPPRVTYVVDPETDSKRAGAVADHAYWLSGLRVAEGAEYGTIDVRSLGFGRGDAPVGEVVPGGGTLETHRGPTPYVSRTRDPSGAPVAPRRDRLVFESTDVARVVVDPRRARVSCNAQLDLAKAPGLSVRLRGCRSGPRHR